MPVKKLRYLLMVALAAMALGLVACGSDDSSDDSGSSGGTIVKNDANGDTPTLTIGSKNFTEQIVLGEIYAQALEAAGYKVKTDLNLGSETVALAALKKGEISGYPEYISTALTSFYDTAPEDVPGDVNGAYEMAKNDLAKDGIVALPPTPFASANAVGMLTSKAK
ncbi:MAG TPA: glycine betaine ABC transporter substrate-binding protein, partial [Solirubrobacterales bacterium]|nr:glycine betaine ABC transporter substrate-binding protein [Solirubrobacterales bacterium]